MGLLSQVDLRSVNCKPSPSDCWRLLLWGGPGWGPSVNPTPSLVGGPALRRRSWGMIHQGTGVAKGTSQRSFYSLPPLGFSTVYAFAIYNRRWTFPGGVMHRRFGSSRFGLGTISAKSVFQALVLAVGIALAATGARSQATFFRPVTNNVSYNVGSEVRVKVILPASDNSCAAPFDISANLRYAGEERFLEEKNVEIASHVDPSARRKRRRTTVHYGKSPRMQEPGVTKW